MARVLVRRGTWVARSRLVQRRRTLDSIESGWARQIATTALNGEVVETEELSSERDQLGR